MVSKIVLTIVFLAVFYVAQKGYDVLIKFVTWNKDIPLHKTNVILVTSLAMIFLFAQLFCSACVLLTWVSQ